MKLAAIALARSIWLFPIAEFNPKGLSLLPCHQYLLDTYNFLKFPKGEELKTQQQYKYEDGAFIGSDGQTLWVNLSVYSDGLVVDTRSSTVDSDYFLNELLTSLTKTFGFAPYETILRKQAYSSEVFVVMAQGLSVFNPKFEGFLQELQNHTSTDNGIKFEAAGLFFQQDPSKLNGSYPFRIERAFNAPYKDNRYYSIAPLQTEKHLRMLDDLEIILRGDPHSS